MDTETAEIDVKTTAEYRQLVANYSDPDWRMENLYKVVNEDGELIPYQRRPAQEAFALNSWPFDVIVKARQLGMSTEIGLECLDTAVFQKNMSCGIIDLTLDDAMKKLNKLRIAYNNLPTDIRREVVAVKENEKELTFSNGSSIEVGTTHRGGTLQFLHVSEFGKIAAQKPETAREIMTGAFNTVKIGQKIKVESTAHGTSGDFYNIVDRSRKMEKEGRGLTPIDFKLHFYGWWIDPKYRLNPNLVAVPAELREYFLELEHKHRIKLDGAQQAWYAKMLDSLGLDDMRSEYPSHIDECFFKSLEGSFFKREMMKARVEKRIGQPIPHDSSRRVHTCWDKGVNENDRNAIWWFQTDGVRYRWIDYYENEGEGIQHYAKYVHDLGNKREFIYGTHYGPHDLKHRQYADHAKPLTEIASDLGIKFEIVPRVLDKENSIEAARRLIGMSWFDNTHCQRGVDALDNYRKMWNRTLGQFTNKPLHDWASNGSDAFQQAALVNKADKENTSRSGRSPRPGVSHWSN